MQHVLHEGLFLQMPSQGYQKLNASKTPSDVNKGNLGGPLYSVDTCKCPALARNSTSLLHLLTKHYTSDNDASKGQDLDWKRHPSRCRVI